MWNPDDNEDEVLVMVCRTGLHTTMGRMVRQLVAPSQAAMEKDPFIPVSCLSLDADNCESVVHCSVQFSNSSAELRVLAGHSEVISLR